MAVPRAVLGALLQTRGFFSSHGGDRDGCLLTCMELPACSGRGSSHKTWDCCPSSLCWWRVFTPFRRHGVTCPAMRRRPLAVPPLGLLHELGSCSGSTRECSCTGGAVLFAGGGDSLQLALGCDSCSRFALERLRFLFVCGLQSLSAAYSVTRESLRSQVAGR